jgi:dihydrofolate reductase
MKLSQFNLVFLQDKSKGISVNDQPPAMINSWKNYVKNLTTGDGNNAVIIGRITYNKLFQNPFDKRHTFIISKSMKQSEHTNITIYPTLIKCLAGIEGVSKKFKNVYVMGGLGLFRECITSLPYLLDKIYCATLLGDIIYDCDMFFPWSELIKKGGLKQLENIKFQDHVREQYSVNVIHQEQQYLDLLIEIIDMGERHNNNRELFNKSLKFDIDQEFPILTTREIDHQKILEEVCDDLKRVSYETDSFGFRLRSSEKFSDIFKKDGISDYGNDPLLDCIQTIDEDLPIFITFHKRKYRDCTINFDKLEMFQKFPYYLTYMSFILYIISHLTGTVVKSIYFFVNNCFIDYKYLDIVKRQVSNTPHPFPQLNFKNLTLLKSLPDFNKVNVEIKGYSYAMKLI